MSTEITKTQVPRSGWEFTPRERAYHAQLQTTMIYLDISTEQEAKAMETLESENDKKVSAKWKNTGNSITAMCGLKQLNKK